MLLHRGTSTRRLVFPTTASLPRRVIPLREKILPKGNFAEESGFAAVTSLAKEDFAKDGAFDKESNLA